MHHAAVAVAAAPGHGIEPLVQRLTEVAAASLGPQQALLPHQHSRSGHQALELFLQHDCAATHAGRAATDSVTRTQDRLCHNRHHDAHLCLLPICDSMDWDTTAVTLLIYG